MSDTGIYGFDEDPGFDMFRDVEFSSPPPQQINDSRSVTRPRSSQDDINPTPTKLGRTSTINPYRIKKNDTVSDAAASAASPVQTSALDTVSISDEDTVSISDEDTVSISDEDTVPMSDEDDVLGNKRQRDDSNTNRSRRRRSSRQRTTTSHFDPGANADRAQFASKQRDRTALTRTGPAAASSAPARTGPAAAASSASTRTGPAAAASSAPARTGPAAASTPRTGPAAAASASARTGPAASIDAEEEPYDMASGINPITKEKIGYKTYYISGIYGCYLMEGQPLTVKGLESKNYTSYDNLKRGFFPLLQTHNNTMNDRRYHQYTYYVEIENINNENDYWNYNLSDAHLINGFVHTIVEEGKKYVFEVEKNELKVNTSLLKPRNPDIEDINYLVLPVKPEIYNNWWKTGIFERTESVSKIKISDTEYDKLHFKINNFRDIKYCGTKGCKIYKNSVKQYWEQYSESPERYSISKELYSKYSEIFETQQIYPEYEPTESVVTRKFDSIIQEIYNRKLPKLITSKFRKQ